MDKSIVLTGGTGFVGSHLLERLLNEDKNVILLKRSFSNTWRIDEFLDDSRLTLIDIDKEDLSSIFDVYSVEGIFHLATYAERFHISSGVSKMIDSNISFPAELLENAVNSNVDFFINTGSFSEFLLKNSPISENSVKYPFNFYATSKIAFEEFLKFYYDNYDLNALTLKLFTPYGPKDDVKKVTPYLVTNSIQNNAVEIKSPTKVLDFVYVTDVVDAYIKAMDKVNKFKKYESFNIGTGEGKSIKYLFSLIQDYLNIDNEVQYGNDESDIVFSSNLKAIDKLGWKPQITLEEGIKKTIDYYKNI